MKDQNHWRHLRNKMIIILLLLRVSFEFFFIIRNEVMINIGFFFFVFRFYFLSLAQNLNRLKNTCIEKTKIFKVLFVRMKIININNNDNNYNRKKSDGIESLNGK